MSAAKDLSQRVGFAPACEALGLARATYYRTRTDRRPAVRGAPALKLSRPEREAIHELIVSERFVDKAPAVIAAELLDEGRYLCSERMMYRILLEHDQVRERRRGHHRLSYEKPELLATGPNQLWSWGITKLKGPVTWSYFYLYVILDVFSRYVVGWMVAERESATLAKRLLQTTCNRQVIGPQQLTLHADRGASMKSKLVAQLSADLGVTKIHCRPHTGDDNPFSEAQFKTLKYRPTFPERFACCQTFFSWYNQEHRHSWDSSCIVMNSPMCQL